MHNANSSMSGVNQDLLKLLEVLYYQASILISFGSSMIQNLQQGFACQGYELH